jgi:hypothetical protein
MKPNRFLRPVPMLGLPLALALLAAVFVAGNAHAATLIHSYDFANGVNGVSDSVGGHYVEFATQIVPTSGSFSVAFWVNEASRSGTWTEVISQGAQAGSGFYLGHNPSGSVRVTDLHQDTGVQFGALNTWMHFTLAVDPTNGTKLYRDGGLIYSVAGGLNTANTGSATRLARQFGAFNEYFSGSLDDLKIYTGALSAAEAQALFTDGRSVGVVPEPGSVALWLLGLAVVGFGKACAANVLVPHRPGFRAA